MLFFKKNISIRAAMLVLLSGLLATGNAIAQEAPSNRIDSTASFLKSPQYYSPLLSPSGKYIASLFLQEGGSSVRILDAAKQSLAPASLTLPENRKPGLIFFGAGKDELFIVARSADNKTALLKVNLPSLSVSVAEEDMRPSFVNVSPASAYRFPQISIPSPEHPSSFRLWDQEKSGFTKVDAVDGIKPVALLPHHMLGYIGVKSEAGAPVWTFVGKDGKQTRLGAYDQSFDRSELISVYQGSDRKYKAAMLDSEKTDTTSLIEIDLESGVRRTLRSDRADIRLVSLSPQTMMPDIVETDYLRPQWQALNNGPLSFLNRLEELPGYVKTIHRSRDDHTWLVEFANASNFSQYYLFDTGINELQPVPALNENDVAFQHAPATHPFIYQTPDQHELTAYMTYPKGRGCAPAHPCPLVVSLHGGPHSRDWWSFQKTNTLLSENGYAVLNVNYRGSGGFGLAFRNLSQGEWGGAMLDDVENISAQVLASGNFDQKNTSIIGGSHGGYLTLMAATSQKHLFHCAVASSATADLETFIRFNVKTQPRMERYFAPQIGDPNSDADLKKMKLRSPMFRADQLDARLLLIHGGKDNSTPLADIEAFSEQLALNKKPFSYLLFPDAGHTIPQGDKQAPYYAALLGFIDECNGRSKGEKNLLPPSVIIKRDDYRIFSSR